MFKVSIIIPVYNVAPYIDRCLLSVLNQSYPNVEIILIDDQGTDNSIEIAVDLKNKHPKGSRITIKHHEKNKGLSEARNTGIISSTGDYIYFLDSDDSVTKDCIELLVESAIRYNSDIVIGDYKCFGANKQTPPLKLDTEYLSSSKDILVSFHKGDWYPMAVNKLIKKELIINKELYFKEGIVHEDELWSFMLACQASNMSIVHKETYLYYLRPNSITGLLQNKEEDLRQSQIVRSNESKRRIVKYMYDYINHTYLYKNENIQLAFEIKKDTLFYTILKTNYYSNIDLYNIYLEFRSLTFSNNLRLLIRKGLDFKTRIKLFHYLLPQKVGFTYSTFLAKYRK